MMNIEDRASKLGIWRQRLQEAEAAKESLGKWNGNDTIRW
jgi:hypothetical protein